MVECWHGKTHSPPPASERRRTGAALPDGERAQRTHVVADPLAAGPGAHGHRALGGHRLPGVLDWPDRQALQRRGTGRDAQPPPHHLLSPAHGVVARAAGGAARATTPWA